MRPKFVTNEDIARWDENINNDSLMPAAIAQAVRTNPILRESMYAGLWLAEQLQQAGCSHENILRLQFTAGRLSFGNDIWTVHQELFDDYKNNRIEWETDYDA